MYHVQMVFKGLVKDGRLLIDIPNRLLKARAIYIQDFKIYSEKANATSPDEKIRYYFDTSCSLFIKEEKIMQQFLDEVKNMISEITSKHGVDIMNSDITLDRVGEDLLYAEDSED